MKLQAGMTAVVTGGGGGIGRAIVLALAGRGLKTYSLDIDGAKNAETASHSAAIVPLHCDVGDPAAIRDTFSRVLETDAIDVLVNNAGIFIGNSYLVGTYEEALDAFDRQMAVNARATYLCTKMAAPGMAARGRGAILNVVTNHLARRLFPPSDSEQAYDATKWAQYQLNESMNAELKRYGIRVNALCPASTRTPMLQGFFDSFGLPLDKETIGRVSGYASLLEPEEVAAAALGVLDWGEDQPTGNAYLLMYSEDCAELIQGHSDRLLIRA